MKSWVWAVVIACLCVIYFSLPPPPLLLVRSRSRGYHLCLLYSPKKLCGLLSGMINQGVMVIFHDICFLGFKYLKREIN